MEALALMLVHLLTPGGLSWTRNGVPKTDAAHKRLKREKAAAAPEDLCRGLPDVFEEFLRYCRRLKFAERPDYELRALEEVFASVGVALMPVAGGKGERGAREVDDLNSDEWTSGYPEGQVGEADTIVVRISCHSPSS